MVDILAAEATMVQAFAWIPLIAALISAGATGYAARQQSKAAKAARNVPMPAATPERPMPVKDDEAARRERLRSIASLGAAGGRQSTFLTRSRLGDDTQADTRAGIISMG